jgi:predicted glycosyltransferase involved in capsule biosynthesis
MNHFPNPNFSPMDKNGNIVISQSDLDDPAKLKQFRQKMLQVHQLLADRQKKYGNTDAIINNAFSYSSEVEGSALVLVVPGHYIGDDFEKTQFHADMISNNNAAVEERLEKINN